MAPPERKTIAQILRCSEDQAAAFARRVQDLVGAPVPPDLIAAAMLKVRARDIASPQRVAEYINQEMARQASKSTAPKRTSTRAQTTSAGAAKTTTRTKARRPAAETESTSTAAPEETATKSKASAPEEAPVSPRDRAEQVEQARARSATTQLDRLLEENYTWASTQDLKVPPRRWLAEEFIREVHRRVFSDKAPRPKIFKVARELHNDQWILTPGAVADRILAEIAAKEGE